MTPHPTQHEIPHQPYEKLIHNPIQQLLLIVPLLLIYHIGTLIYADTLAVPYHFKLLFASWHAPMAFLPSLLIVTTLIFQHALRRDRFCYSIGIQLGMILEGATLWLPLLPVLWVTSQFTAATTPPTPVFITNCINYIGASVYEEFLFRAVLMSLLGLLLIDVLHVKKLHAQGTALLLSTFLFARAHFEPFSTKPFDEVYFLFLLVAGIWFGVIYLWRGLGVAIATHMIWNLVVALAGHSG
ncbi:MAG: CPBP family intramembrane metalloprotease [Phycisphaerales bacterium]|jgi:membrane protease YdiL (CAAX protease family)|nr:CPBP family intramembrane metalloprotease [Phycisphaerales bacterium]MBT7171135.1 CPBP family intramembrane metalloprotease [Phycisphaerales bacterium]